VKRRSRHKVIYNRRKWQVTRRQILFENPLCQFPGCGEIAVDVHHAGGYANPFDPAGLEALCKRHHGEITRAEQLQRRELR
jgi:hypothetical protein